MCTHGSRNVGCSSRAKGFHPQHVDERLACVCLSVIIFCFARYRLTLERIEGRQANVSVDVLAPASLSHSVWNVTYVGTMNYRRQLCPDNRRRWTTNVGGTEVAVLDLYSSWIPPPLGSPLAGSTSLLTN